MNSNEFEIYNAIRDVQRGPTIIRYLCCICKDYLNDWDVKSGKAICWRCRKTYWPKPRVGKRTTEPGQPRLVQPHDDLHEMPVD